MVSREIGGITVSNIQWIILIATLVSLGALQFVVYRTKVGRGMRAVSHDLVTAGLMGVNVDAVIAFTFGLGAALAGVGGVLYGIAYPQINTFMGVMPGLKAFTAAVLGGIGIDPGGGPRGADHGAYGDDDHGVSLVHLPGRDRLRPPDRRVAVEAHRDPREGPDGEGVTAGDDLPEKHRKAVLPFAVLSGLVQFLSARDILNPYWVQIFQLACVVAISALGLNLIYGFTGLFSLGHAAFYGVGAYTAALLTKLYVGAYGDEAFFATGAVFLGSLLAGGVAAALLACLVGLPTFRLTSDYLGIATLGFGVIMKVFFDNADSLVPQLGGARGMTGIPRLTGSPVGRRRARRRDPGDPQPRPLVLWACADRHPRGRDRRRGDRGRHVPVQGDRLHRGMRLRRGGGRTVRAPVRAFSTRAPSIS